MTSYKLAWHVHTEIEDGAVDTRHTDYVVDATSGDILRRWSTLQTASAAATGTGHSQYSGDVTLDTADVGGAYELRDLTRGSGGGNCTYDLAHGSSGTGTLYLDADDAWGDGLQYVEGGPTTDPRGQTAAADAAFGVAQAWDYYLTVHGRRGIDGAGAATYSRVHYGTSYDNAFWSDDCFCMTYGDGDVFTTMTALDVTGHELTHGVTSQTAGLVYYGESGGLNEATSDIFGTMVEFRARPGTANWTIGEALASEPLRYMYKPSLDGYSPDAWYPGIGELDVHFSSGPMNRAFYFLAAGASPSGPTSTPHLPTGMSGVGNSKAERIWYRALMRS